MKSFGILAASALFGAMVNAAPVNKRAVVWITETEVDIVTVPITKTVWAGADETHTRHPHSQKASVTSLSSVVPTTSTSAVVAPVTTSVASSAEPATSSSSVYVAPTTSSTSVYVAPTTSSTSVYVAPTTSSTSVYVAPTTSSTPVSVAPTTSTYIAPTTSTSSAAAATSSSSSGSGQSSGLAASGTSYTGDFTWYDVGLGSCGLTNVASDHVVAISKVIFDSYSTGNPNTNPLCGKSVTLTGKDGSSYQAKVVDRCVGCAQGDLDLSADFFNIVTSNGNGRVADMSWSWN